MCDKRNCLLLFSDTSHRRKSNESNFVTLPPQVCEKLICFLMFAARSHREESNEVSYFSQYGLKN